MSNLPKSVYAGIGTSGPEDLDLFRKQLSRRVRQFALNSFRVVLYLPAAIAATPTLSWAKS